MADPTPNEQLQPALLDRLTDEERESSDESRERRVISLRRLRESVMRDLGWLLNCGNLRSTVPLEEVLDESELELVSGSVLNFGVADLAGATASGTDLAALERAIRQAIWDFEPRLLRHTVRVRAVSDPTAMSHNALSFDIEAELWADPVPQRLYLKTAVDLESGNFSVSDGTGPGR